MLSQEMLPVWIGVILLSGLLLVGQDCLAQTGLCDPDPCQSIPNAVAGTCSEIGGSCTGPSDFFCSCDGGYTWQGTTHTCEGSQPTCADSDEDGYGDPADASCTYPELDCDDSDEAINPGSTEICSDDVDNDCDGLVDVQDPQCAVPAEFGDLVITELMVDPDAVEDAAGEYVEVFNLSNNLINLNGLVLRDYFAAGHQIGQDLLVAPGGYVVLGRNADYATNGGVDVDYEYAAFYLLNSTDQVMIETQQGFVLDSFAYSDLRQNPGVAIELPLLKYHPDFNDDQNEWCDASTPLPAGDLGSPGFDNTCM